MTDLELKLIARLNYIPDEMLQAYLADKILVRPNYPAAIDMQVESRYEEYKANMKAAQKESNKVANPKRR